ncbi:hypothetical protein FSP39_020745 [Pinctada imbricata]|uniref:C17orf113 probable zinc finger domain-containing protein n=1 Tax=Pinctada imbricata TaxID=66713 RepID=A0AA89C775_PINIB|nr:hypothetical protein FSP39_020745 [Pinctada imbricata]
MYCREFSVSENNSFVKGCNSYKADSIVKHESSKQHQQAASIVNGRTEKVSKASKIIMSMNKDKVDRLTTLFRTCHALVMNNRPLRDYIWLCNLDEINGLDLGVTYRNENSKQFGKAIADVEFKKMTCELSEIKYICLIGDGSTDSSVVEQEMCAEAERAFSQLKLIKANLRSKMTDEVLNRNLIIKLHSPDVNKYDPSEAKRMWNVTSTRSRRPLTKPIGKSVGETGLSKVASTASPDNVVMSYNDVEISKEITDHDMDVDSEYNSAHIESDESEHKIDANEMFLQYEKEIETEFA